MPKKDYQFIKQGLTITRRGKDLILRTDEREMTFCTVRPDYRTRSEADQLRRAIELVEVDLYYDSEGERDEMVGAESVD